MSINQSPVMLTIRQCAALSGVSISTIRKAIDGGDLIAQNVFRCVRIHRDNFEAWTRSRPVVEKAS